MVRKVASATAIVVLSAFTLAACSGSASDNKGSASDAPKGNSPKPKEIQKVYIYQNTGALN
jgi:outer membrane biogenesis lipoprotein LolB